MTVTAQTSLMKSQGPPAMQVTKRSLLFKMLLIFKTFRINWVLTLTYCQRKVTTGTHKEKELISLKRIL
jgi:hypothetical protein